jgi:hypothetical protein
MLRDIALRALALAFVCLPAHAQTYSDAGGTIISAVAPIPFPYIPLSPGQHNLAPTSAAGLTIPTGARYATICASTATVRYTTDGTTLPTSSVGMPLSGGACMNLSGAIVLANFRAFATSGTLDVEYFK